MKSVFEEAVKDELLNRLNQLSEKSQPHWGKMNVSEMLAHCNVAYELDEKEEDDKIKGLKKFILKLLIKPTVTNEKPYKKNSTTAPEFRIADKRDFDIELKKLKGFVELTFERGPSFYEGRMSYSFGALNSKEYSNMYFKHLDHHLNQFGV